MTASERKGPAQWDRWILALYCCGIGAGFGYAQLTLDFSTFLLIAGSALLLICNSIVFFRLQPRIYGDANKRRRIIFWVVLTLGNAFGISGAFYLLGGHDPIAGKLAVVIVAGSTAVLAAIHKGTDR